MNALIIPAILLGFVFILELLGMPDKWACLCGFLLLPVTLIVAAIIDHKTHYFRNRQRELVKSRRAAQRFLKEWDRILDEEWEELKKEDPEGCRYVEREIEEGSKPVVDKHSTVGFPSGGF